MLPSLFLNIPMRPVRNVRADAFPEVAYHNAQNHNRSFVQPAVLIQRCLTRGAASTSSRSRKGKEASACRPRQASCQVGRLPPRSTAALSEQLGPHPPPPEALGLLVAKKQRHRVAGSENAHFRSCHLGGKGRAARWTPTALSLPLHLQRQQRLRLLPLALPFLLWSHSLIPSSNPEAGWVARETH